MKKPRFVHGYLSVCLCVIVVLSVFSRSSAQDDWGSPDDWGTPQDWGTSQDWETPQQAKPDAKKSPPFIVNFDKNADGKVSETEFPGGPMGFKRLDANSDGYIDQNEAPKGPPSPGKRP
jgi:hypothetical protein